MRVAVISDLEPDLAFVRFDYDEDAVALLKELRCRWDPRRRGWTFPEWKADLVAEALEDCGFEVKRNTAPPPPSGRTASPPGLVQATEAYLRALPEELRKRAYWALSRALHPDAGGDTGAMQALNEAWRRAS